MRIKIIAAFFCFYILCLTVTGSHAVDISAESAVLIEADSGEVIYEKNADVRMPMASTTKIMTALVAIENGNLDDTVTITDKMIGAEGSSIYLKSGEKLTLEQLLYALMLASANDSAEAIAVHVAGSVEEFAVLMNKKAKELDLENTNFTNPHGLDDELHYTTARELSQLTAHALQNQKFAEIVSTYNYTIPETELNPARYLTNHNKLLKLYDGSIGVKTGFTKRCGRCLVSAAERDGVKLVAVTLSAPNDWNDHISMLDCGFDLYKSVTLADIGSLTFELPVACGTKDSVTVTNKDKFELTLRNDSSKIECKVESFVGKTQFAPIEKDECLAEAVFYMESKEIARLPLYASESVKKTETEESFWDFLK